MSNMTQAWLSARDRPRQTHLSAHPAPLAWPAALALLTPTASEGAGTQALSAPPQPQHTQTTDGFVAKYFIAATPMVDTGIMRIAAGCITASSGRVQWPHLPS